MPRKSKSQEHPMNEPVKVKLSEIDPKSTVNVRQSGIEESVEVVKSSIEKNDYWPEFPVVLRPHPEPQSEFAYENVSGQCRTEACRQLGHEEIPAVIADLDDNAAQKRSFDENDKKTPLSPSDYTRIVQGKHEEFKNRGYTPEEAFKKTAEFWNISVAKAKRYHRFGSLPESLKKKVDHESLPEDAADVIVTSSDSIADEEERMKVMEEKAEWFGKQEKKDRKEAKEAIRASGSNATPEELDEKIEELGHSGKTLKIELEEGGEPKLKKWGAGQGLPNKTPLSVIASQLINKTLRDLPAADGNKQ